MDVIINGDDFGGSEEVNRAIERAHLHGILTSASLMVNGVAVEQAVDIYHRMPDLDVGLHLVVIAGKACLPPKEIPHLVDRNGHFRSQPLQAGLQYFFNRSARQELKRELSAQFESFASTGLPLDHVNGHQHLHLHPAVFSLVLPLAREYQAAGIRVPRDQLKLALQFDRTNRGGKMAYALIFHFLNNWCLQQAKNNGFVITDQVFGLYQSGAMHESYCTKIIQQARGPVVEIYFHPSTSPHHVPLGPNQDDYQTLLSPRIKSVLAKRGATLSTYSEVRNNAR